MAKFDSQHQTIYIQMLQQLIGRMHAASLVCKQVCVGIVAAFIALAAAKDLAPGLAVAPVVILGLLDSYYLSFEKDFVRNYNRFAEALHEGDSDALMYRLNHQDGGSRACKIVCAARSFSIWAFYGALSSVAIFVSVVY